MLSALTNNFWSRRIRGEYRQYTLPANFFELIADWVQGLRPGACSDRTPLEGGSGARSLPGTVVATRGTALKAPLTVPRTVRQVWSGVTLFLHSVLLLAEKHGNAHRDLPRCQQGSFTGLII